jgi:hypothetical protein
MAGRVDGMYGSSSSPCSCYLRPHSASRVWWRIVAMLSGRRQAAAARLSLFCQPVVAAQHSQGFGRSCSASSRQTASGSVTVLHLAAWAQLRRHSQLARWRHQVASSFASPPRPRKNGRIRRGLAALRAQPYPPPLQVALPPNARAPSYLHRRSGPAGRLAYLLRGSLCEASL